MDKQKVVCILGPTAVGKTKMGIEIAKAFNGEIISGDSMQIYRGMDIGTAKVKEKEMQGVKHHLIDIKNPDEPFTVAQFQQMVKKTIDDIDSRGKLSIIVGGTGLYVEAALQQYSFSDSESDEAFRMKLERIKDEQGVEVVHNMLAEVDPESAERIHPNNTRRVIRALEIFHCTGMKMSDKLEEENKEYVYDAVLIGLTMDREKLYSRINERVNIMMEEGLLEEAKSFYDAGLRDCQSIQAIGYKEWYEFFEGKATYGEALENLKRNSRRYAKRQLTWFRNKMDVRWFAMDLDNQEKIFHDICAYIEGKSGCKSEL